MSEKSVVVFYHNSKFPDKCLYDYSICEAQPSAFATWITMQSEIAGIPLEIHIENFHFAPSALTQDLNALYISSS